jgi:hypothetical protein
MKKVFWYLLFGASLFVSYMGYQNATVTPQLKAQARSVACMGIEGCTIEATEPFMYKTGITGQTYGWGTSSGNVTVTCKREFMFAGNWTCASENSPNQVVDPVS